MWDFPTTAELSNSTTTMASLFTSTDAPQFLIGATRYQNLTVVQGGPNIDAAAWVDESSGQALVSVVNLDYNSVTGPVTIALPEGISASSVTGSLWGEATWQAIQNGTLGVEGGLGGLETTVFLIRLV